MSSQNPGVPSDHLPLPKKPRGGPRPGAGRKPGSTSGRRLTHGFLVRLREEDAKALAEAAERRGWGKTKLARACILDRLSGRQTVFDASERKLLVEVLHEIRRQGSNLNQIAYGINRVAAGLRLPDDMPSPEDVSTTARKADKAIARLLEVLSLTRLR